MTTLFFAHSFATGDTSVVQTVHRFLESFGIDVRTGEEPAASAISDKVVKRIKEADLFAALFTRFSPTDAKPGKYEPSQWVIEETYSANGANKPLLLFRENDVEFTIRLKPDYEFVPFDRSDLAQALVRAVPYVLSAIKNVSGEEVEGTPIDIIDEYEARRIIDKMEQSSNVTALGDKDEQNVAFRHALTQFVAVELDGNYAALLFLLTCLKKRGYSIEPVPLLLFQKYHRMNRAAVEHTLLALKGGIRM